MGLRSDGGRVHAQFCAGQHGEEGPNEQRTTAHGEGKKEAKRGPAENGGKLRTGVKHASCKARGKEQDGGQGERAEARVAGLRKRRRGGRRHG